MLEVEGLAREGVFRDITLPVRAGEIVALAGLVGAGRSEVMQAVFGVDPYDAGTVTVAGKRLKPGSPRAAMAAGMALVPEDRRQQGLVMELSVERNVTLPRSRKLARARPALRRRRAPARRTSWTQRLQTKCGRLSDPVGTLSGGNQQKVVLAKWLATDPRAADRRRADPRHRRRHQGRGAPADVVAGRRRARGRHGLVRAARGARAWPTGSWCCARAGMAAELTRAEATEETVMYAAMGQQVAA